MIPAKHEPVVPISWKLFERRNDPVKSSQLVQLGDIIPGFVWHPGYRFIRLILFIQNDSASKQEPVLVSNYLVLGIQNFHAHVEREQHLVLLEQAPTGVPDTKEYL